MSIPTYTFLQKNAALRDEPKRFADALIASGRFGRDESGFIRFKVGEGDHVRIENKHALREILLSGESLKLEGDISDAAFDCLWSWFVARKWTFPRLNPQRPYNPPKPLPISRTGAAYVNPYPVRR